MSWGYKILLTYTVFIGSMLFMVYTASKQTNEMEDDKYYVKELAYQQTIDAKKNLLALPEKLSFLDSANVLVVKIPVAATQNISEGHMEFMRSADQRKDVVMTLSPDKNGRQEIDKSRFIKGYYKLRIGWQSNSIPYYAEEMIFIK